VHGWYLQAEQMCYYGLDNIWGTMLKRALAAGAIKLSARELVPIIKKIEGM